MSNAQHNHPRAAHPAPMRFMTLRELRGEASGPRAPTGPRRPPRLVLRTVRA